MRGTPAGRMIPPTLLLAVLALTGCPHLATHHFQVTKIQAEATLVPPGDHRRVDEVGISPDGKWARAHQVTGQTTFWSLEGRTGRATDPDLVLPPKEWRSSAFSADWTRAVTCEGREPSWSEKQAGERTTQTLKVWLVHLDGKADVELRAQKTFDTEVARCTSLLLTQDGEWAVTLERPYVQDREHVLRLWQISGSGNVRIELVDTIRLPVEAVTGGAVLGGGDRYVLSRTQAGEYRLFLLNRTEGRLKEIGEMRHGDGYAQAVGFSPDGRWAMTGAFADEELWKLAPDAAPQRVAQARPDMNSVRASTGVLFHPDGRLVLSGRIDTACLWRIDDGNEPLALSDTLTGHGGAVRCLAFTEDGGWALTGAQDAVAALWEVDAARGKCRARAILVGHDHYVISAGFSRDGRRAVTGSNDGTIRYWNLAGTEGE